MIRKSLADCGAGRSVLVDANNELIAGNGVYEQAQALGIPTRIIETDGSELVVVKRTDLQTDDRKRKELALADNAASDKVEWNMEEIKCDFADIQLEDWGIEVPEIETDEDIVERKKREFDEKMAAGELDEDDPEYQEFVKKFEAKKTTDDCYTPELVYNAVADWVANEYAVNKANFVRPFYPGGDYQREKYKATDIVVDNPPFSILSQILQWYNEHGIRYFLFAPHLTLFGTAKDKATTLCIDVTVTYANGANVSTSFVTNMEDADILFKSSPTLYKAVNDANIENLRQNKIELPRYNYPSSVILTPAVARFSKCGIGFECRKTDAVFIRELDAQKEYGKALFGGGYLMSTSKTTEREKVEREKVEREKAGCMKFYIWELSEREKEIVNELDNLNPQGE